MTDNTALISRLRNWANAREIYFNNCGDRDPNSGSTVLRQAADALEHSVQLDQLDRLRRELEKALKESSGAPPLYNDAHGIIAAATDVARRYTFGRRLLHQIAAKVGTVSTIKGWSKLLMARIEALVAKPEQRVRTLTLVLGETGVQVMEQVDAPKPTPPPEYIAREGQPKAPMNAAEYALFMADDNVFLNYLASSEFQKFCYDNQKFESLRLLVRQLRMVDGQQVAAGVARTALRELLK